MATTRRASGASRKDMPQEHLFLLMTGHLMATERAEIVPQQPPMMCGTCGEKPLDLIWRHTPWTEAEIWSKQGKRELCECGEVHGSNIPGTVWGDDITPICPCCSFAHCTHKKAAA